MHSSSFVTERHQIAAHLVELGDWHGHKIAYNRNSTPWVTLNYTLFLHWSMICSWQHVSLPVNHHCSIRWPLHVFVCRLGKTIKSRILVHVPIGGHYHAKRISMANFSYKAKIFPPKFCQWSSFSLIGKLICHYHCHQYYTTVFNPLRIAQHDS